METIIENDGHSIIKKGNEYVLYSDSGESISLGSNGIEGLREEIKSLHDFADSFIQMDKSGLLE